MSLKKKIALSFLISAAIIAILAAFEYLSFVEIRKEIRYLEITDTISRKSLQLRRHEKNFFLYSPLKADEESRAVHAYLGELKDILARNPDIDKADQLSLRVRISEYEQRFDKITATSKDVIGQFQKIRSRSGNYGGFPQLVESAFLERPQQAAGFLEKAFRLPPGHGIITGLRELDSDITALRKTGEDILVISKDLDKIAREKVEAVIRISQIAILIFFPLFFIVGIGMLFLISKNVARRLMLLISVVERTGKGSYPHLTDPSPRGARDEVGVLIEKFNDMEDQLALHEEELERKNKELMQTKKLAAIGTLASGVAHELNNPLNNIYLSAQILAREAGEHCSPAIQEVLNDILNQTVRVKKIVGDLLEYARGREPRFEELDLSGLIRGTLNRLAKTAEGITIGLESLPEQVSIEGDAGQLEQVFVNLFTNAVEAMKGKGALQVKVNASPHSAVIRVSDTGKGIPKESVEKIFEPFFTTKDKGTGLGLAIVYNIIMKHGGGITVESEEGKGTTFAVTLPAKQEKTED
jgi:signal transduction histidine kinase